LQKKFIKLGSLAFLQIVIVGNLQALPANAVYGSSLPFLYLIAILGFFLPCVLVVAELATTRPQTGGAYIWCEQAFGQKVGFFTVCILWVSNLLWYPSIFSLIAANVAYLFDPSLAQDKIFVVCFSVILFWLLTGLNCLSVKFSSLSSVVCAVIGIIFPMIIVIIAGIVWLLAGKTRAISLSGAAFLPDISHFNNVGLLIAVVISLFGIELTAVHAGNVFKPSRNYLFSLLISSVTVIILLLFSEMAIAIIIPSEKLSVVTGLLDALMIFFHEIHTPYFVMPVLLLVLFGNIGSVAAWMLGSTRGMYVACQKNNVTKFLQKINRYESPIGVLIFEAIIFTLVSSIFLIFPHITDSFWLMLTLASQVTLIYYIIIFIAGIRLRYIPSLSEGFVIPGGMLVLWLIMLTGVATSFLALIVGFIPPENLANDNIMIFHIIMATGLTVTLGLPFLLLNLRKSIN
jgi:glutamate:GABA antiporter